MAFNIGVNVLETDGTATPSIVGAATSVAAFLIRSSRGVEDEVFRITSWGQFKETFGPPAAGAFGYYAVKGFFENGGSVAYVSRITDAAVAVAASRGFGAPDLTVTAGSLGVADRGTWGNDVSVRIVANAAVAGTYDLQVRFRGRDVEVWDRLTNAAAPQSPERGAAATVNDPSSGSKYIRVTQATANNPAPNGGFDPLQNGADDTMNAAAIEAAAAAGWSRFDAFDVQLLACPEVNTAPVVSAALTYCSNRGDCMYVGHTNESDAAGAARTYGAAFRGNKIYGALYFPWIEVAQEGGGRLWVPPDGHVIGVYARTETERGVWKAPAGVQAQVKGALALRQLIGDVDHTDLVKNGSVNALRFVPGAGIIVDSSRTLSTNPLWYYVNVRLLFNYVKTSLRQSLRWVVQEPNSEELWQKVKINSVTPFLMGLWRRGAFGPGAPNAVFTVKCDADTNPPANIQQGIFTVEVYMYPSRPAETVIIVVGQQDAGGSAAEA